MNLPTRINIEPFKYKAGQGGTDPGGVLIFQSRIEQTRGKTDLIDSISYKHYFEV